MSNLSNPSLDCTQVFAQHERWLRRVVYARLANANGPSNVLDEVDEVMQEVAIALVSQQQQLRQADKLQAWLYQVAVRQALMFRRAAGRRKKLQAAFAGVPSEGPSAPDPLDWLIHSERREQVKLALNELPSRDREILLLKHGENMKYQQIADITGLSVSAVESRLHRARQKLRARLAPLRLNSGRRVLPRRPSSHLARHS